MIEEDHMVKCEKCGKSVSILEARSGAGGKPIHEECW